jgi:cytochrome c2
MKLSPFLTLLAGLIVGLVGKTTWAADAEKGKEIYDRRCQICHSTESGVNKLGPSLAGVFGRKAGAVPGYNYSDALKGSDIVWNARNLDPWLADPHRFVPGDKMPFPGLKNAADRQDVIAYLKALK